EGERVGADELLPARAGRKQFGVVQRHGEKATRREQPRPQNAQPLPQRQADARTEPGTEQDQPVHQARLPALQRRRQLAAPGDGRQEDGWSRAKPTACAPWGSHPPQEIRDVVEQAAEAGGVAAVLLVEACAAAVQERDGEAGLAELAAGMFVPAAVT